MKQLLHLVPILVLLQAACLAVCCVTNRLRGLPQPRAFAFFTVLIFAATWPPLSWVATGSLEWWYSTNPLPTAEADAIVILSGAADPPRPHRPVVHLGRDSYARCRHGAWLYKAWRPLPVLVCGGRPEIGEAVETLASYMKNFLTTEGVPPEKIIEEDRSATTHENARFAVSLLRERQLRTIVLVTDGWHMPRAAASFRAQGIKVIPAPATLRSARFEGPLGSWLPSHHALVQNERVLHEWLGLAWYLVSGRF
jgi:uncharacterized SAM-binding protein YcdF (DUF218 family)